MWSECINKIRDFDTDSVFIWRLDILLFAHSHFILCAAHICLNVSGHVYSNEKKYTQ